MSIVSYANPIRSVYVFGSSTALQFGAAGETADFTFVGPKGRKGLVRDIEIDITEVMLGTTTVPEIVVGSSASTAGSIDDDYARFRLGTAAGSGYGTDQNALRASSLVDSENEVGAATLPGKQSTDFTGHVILEKAFIPADTEFHISFVEGVDGTETGAGHVRVEVDWF